MANILWLDNDRTFLMPFVSRLEFAGHTVIQTYTVFEAERYLMCPDEGLGADRSWDLVIIDVMMPVKPDGSKNQRYGKEETANGHRTGVVFYEYNGELILGQGAIAAALTMRDDPKIRAELAAVGLPAENFMHKMAVADTRDFLAWVEELLAQRKDS